MKRLLLMILMFPLFAYAKKIGKDELISVLRACRPQEAKATIPGTLTGYTYTDNGLKWNGGKLVPGNAQGTPVSPRATADITDTRGREYHFYLNTILLEDSVIKGYESRSEPQYRMLPVNMIKKVKVHTISIPYYYREAF